MSDYDDYDFGEGNGPERKERGLTRETVDMIYKHVLGVDIDSDLPLALQAQPQSVPEPARNQGRFKPGQSGNPAGRRKQFNIKAVPAHQLDQDLLAALVQESLLQKVSVNRDGVAEQRTIFQIVVDTQIMKAAKGSTSAARFVDSLHMRAKGIEARQLAAKYAQWKDRKARYAAIHERGKKHGIALNWDCPHPDDIILGPGHLVTIVGPMTPEELSMVRDLYERLPCWLMIAAYESWLQKRRLRARPDCPHAHAALVSAHMFEAGQRLLPPSLRMSPAHIEAQLAEWDSIAGRALHDLLRAEANKADLPVPPRALRIPFTLAHPLSEAVVPDVPDVASSAVVALPPQDQSVVELFHEAWTELMRMQCAQRFRA